MSRPRGNTSPADEWGANMADVKSRLNRVELLAHQPCCPPAGSISDYIGTTAPDGWAIMDGSTITNGQTLYPDLWAVLPLTYKFGSSIILPDTRGKVSVGRNASDADFDTIGDMGGAKTVTLTTAEIPSHNHTQNAHSHSLGPGQDFGTFFGGNPGGFATFALQVQAINQATYQGAYSASGNTATNNPAGGGGAHTNLQPFIVFSKIIRLT
jgi:microcystin-dependent protein